MEFYSHKTLAVALVTLFSFLTAPILAVFAQNTPSELTPNFFSRNLRVGEQGGDVQILQKVLNSSPETKLGESGPGASGEETTYFGELTKSAVIRFQEKYMAEILTPLDLTQGTGFVGPMTRKKLNEAAKTAGITEGSITSGGSTGTTGASQGSSSQTTAIKPKIISISPASGINGTDIVIAGEGFTPTDNIVQTTLLTSNNLPSKDGRTIEFKFYSDTVNSMLGVNAMKQEGVTREEFINDINEIRIAHPKNAFPAGKLPVAPTFISISNKNGVSNSVKFNLDMDTTHYLATSTSTVSVNTKKRLTLLQKIADFMLNTSITNTAEARSRSNSCLSLGQDPDITQGDSNCKFNKAQQKANNKWSDFSSMATGGAVAGGVAGGSAGGAGGGGGAGGNGLENPFGGNVVVSIPCLCSLSTAFIIRPVYGSAGPYNVYWWDNAIKEMYSLFIPFNLGYWVLGTSAPEGEGICSIWVVVACFEYDAAEVLPLPGPGVGSSLTI